LENDKYTKDEIKKDIMKMYSSPIYQELNEHYSRDNIFSVIRKSRSENVHSDFLAWLFDSHSKHGLGLYPVEMLLRLFDFAKTKKFNSEAYLPQIYENIIYGNEYKIIDIRVSREKAVKRKGRADRPVDICLEIGLKKFDQQSFLVVVIENKVKSSEHDEQTIDYYQRMQDKYKDTDNVDVVYAYLTPKSSHDLENMSEQDCQCKKFIQINYQYLLDYVIQPCYERAISTDAKFFIENYIHCLGDTSFFDDDEDDNKVRENKGGVTIMAVSREENTLLRKFWDENEKLIKASINSVLNDDDYDNISDNDRKIMNNALQINTKSKGKKFLYNGEKISLNRIVLNFVKYYVEQNPNVNYASLCATFPKKLQGSFGVVKNVQDLTDSDKGINRANGQANFYLDDEITLADGVKIVVCNQWGAGGTNPNFFAFKKKMEELGYGDMIEEI